MDIKLRLLADHICWVYEPRSKKSILPFGSAHSKLVKRGIANTGLEAFLKKSCCNSIQASFALQIARLKEVGYPQMCLNQVAESLLKKFRGKGKPARERGNVRPAVIPYLDSVSQNLKKVGQR